MRRIRWSLVLLFLLLGIQAMPASADCGAAPAVPARPADVRGYAWIGVLQSVEHMGSEADRHRWRIERVISGEVPKSVAYVTSGCWRVPAVRLGDTYLLSTASLEGPTGLNTVIYRIKGDKAVRLVPTALRRFYAPTFDVDSLADATALVVPRLPGTDTIRTPTREAALPAVRQLLQTTLWLVDLLIAPARDLAVQR